MAHQQIFIKNDTLFNESFAAFVEDTGSMQWVKRNGDNYELMLYEEKKRKRSEIEELLRSAKEKLEILYSKNLKKNETAVLKEKIFLKLRASLLRLKDGRDASKNYNNWVSQINSAWLGAFSLYDRYKPFFKNIFIENNSDWPAFYKEVRKLKKVKKSERVQIIENFLKLR